MSYLWVYNILCEIREGRAFLSPESQSTMNCPGTCYSCKAFLGVDPSGIGNEYLRSCCDAFCEMRVAGPQRGLRPQPKIIFAMDGHGLTRI